LISLRSSSRVASSRTPPAWARTTLPVPQGLFCSHSSRGRRLQCVSLAQDQTHRVLLELLRESPPLRRCLGTGLVHRSDFLL
jgi:hypothetical protein